MTPGVLAPLGTVAIAVAQSVNTQRQLKWQKEQLERSQAFQRENAEEMRRFQYQLHETDYARRLEREAELYTETNAWPLRFPPSAIVKNLLGDASESGEIPLNLIIAPPTQGIRQQFGTIWSDLAFFIQQHFALNGRYPVIPLEGAYKNGFVSNPNNDVMALYQGLKRVPTLFIAPYSTERDSVLGIMAAVWGTGFSEEKPSITHVTWDLSKVCRHLLREEVREYRRRIESGLLASGDNPDIEKNEEVFIKEKALLDRGNTEEGIAQYSTTYKPLRMSDWTAKKLGDVVLPSMELFASAVGDLYWILAYGRTPRLPAIIKSGNLLRADSAGIFIENYVQALLAGRESVSPRHMIDLAADFNALGNEAAAKRLIAGDAGLAGEATLAGDMASIAMCERRDDITPLLPARTNALLDKWGRSRHEFGSLELQLLKSGEMDAAHCIEAAQECYDLGRYGRAMELLHVAAENGDSNAMWMIGAYYYLGKGVKKDFERARYWCRKSASLGNEKGMEYLEDMGVPCR